MKGDEVIHIRVGKELKAQMKALVKSGLFSTEAELIRTALNEFTKRGRR